MPAKSQDPQLPNGLDQNAISDLAQLLCLLLSSLNAKTINLLRFYELQIDFLQRRLHGRLVPNEAERAAFALAGVTEHPDEAWMAQMARNMTMEDEPFLKGRRFLIADRDTKFSASYRNILKNAGLQTLPLPPRSPNLNAFAERWVRTIKEECLDGLLLPGPASVTKAIKEYLLHYHHERPHQGIGNRIPFPVLAHPDRPQHPDQLQRKSRLGGLLNSYYWQGQTPLTSAA